MASTGACNDAMSTLRTLIARRTFHSCPPLAGLPTMPVTRVRPNIAAFHQPVSTDVSRAILNMRLHHGWIFAGKIGPASRPPAAMRTLTSSTRSLGRVVDDLASGPLTSLTAAARPDSRPKEHDSASDHGERTDAKGSRILDALYQVRPRETPWWWRVAKAQVEAEDRSRERSRRTRRRFAWHWRATPAQQAIERAGPSAASTHDCHHSSSPGHGTDTFPFRFHCGSDSGSSSSWSSSSERSRGNSGAHRYYRRGHNPSACAQPLTGCRTSSRSWSWLYLVVNERRRRDPARHAGHFRNACREWRDFTGHSPYGRTPRVDGWTTSCAGERKLVSRRLCPGDWDTVRQAHDRHKRSVRGLALHHRAKARAQASAGGPAAASSTSGAQTGPDEGGDRAGPFDHEAFRRTQWARLLGNGRQRRGHREVDGSGHEGRHRGPRWTRTHTPQDWVRLAHRRYTNKRGVLFFTWRACDSQALRIGEGGMGASRIHVARSSAGAPAHGGIASPRLPLSQLALQASAKFPHVPMSTPGLALRAGSARAFSTSPAAAVSFIPPSIGSLPPVISISPCTPFELALPLLLPLASILKSSAALNVLSFVTRISLTLLPLSARSRIIYALRERYLRDPSSLASSIFGRCALERHVGTLAAPSGLLTRWNALLGLPLLVLTPIVLLLLVALASLERTPITGRWRMVMLSPAEEAELVRSVLRPTTNDTASRIAPPEGTSRDWVATLQRVLDLPDEGCSPTTGRRRLLGGEVLDPRDWRVRWAEAVLRALEQGAAPALATTSSANVAETASSRPGVERVLVPPPTAYPLEPRPEALAGRGATTWSDELVLSKPAHAHHAHAHAQAQSASPRSGTGEPALRLEYDLLVVDRPDANAFSFGFGPDAPAATSGPSSAGPRRGVIVVYTGFLDEILGRSRGAPSTSGSSASTHHHPDSDPLRANLAPAVLPTDAQTRQLAVLLAHELSHLVLSHTLESYASSSLLVPHLARLTSDVVRTVLYPVTALLGPFLNDALGKSLNEGAQGGFGILADAANSCESRKLESEADVVALRLLASSGIDPHCALSFWEDRVAVEPAAGSDPLPASSAASAAPAPTHAHVHPRRHPHTVRSHSTPTAESLMRSHPVDADRVQRIRDELDSWQKWWAARPVPEHASTAVGAPA